MGYVVLIAYDFDLGEAKLLLDFVLGGKQGAHDDSGLSYVGLVVDNGRFHTQNGIAKNVYRPDI